jgi:hypothetical protein
MDAALIARLVAAGRMGFGVALTLTPERVTTPWLGSAAARPATRVVTRGLGARDLALGAGALAAGATGATGRARGADLQRWVAAGIVADAADLAATVAAGDSLPLRGRVLVGAVAGGGAALGALALAGLRA